MSTCIDLPAMTKLNLKLIKQFEGLRLYAYRDSVGVATIGYGSTFYPDGRKVKMSDRLSSAEEADRLMRHVIEQDFLRHLRKHSWWEQMNTNQQSAILSFAYNLGAHFYGNRGFGSITKLVDNPKLWVNKGYVHNVFVKYSMAGGRRLKGLVRRRAAEAALFSAPVETGEVLKPIGGRYSKIIARRNTLLKKGDENGKPVQSGKLDDDQKISIHEGRELGIEKILQKEGGHYQVRLQSGSGDWWIWKPHWEIQ